MADLGSSVAEGEVEGGRQALVCPASKVNQLHAEAAAEPHDIGRPQIPMHNFPLVQPCYCLANLQNSQRLVVHIALLIVVRHHPRVGSTHVLHNMPYTA